MQNLNLPHTLNRCLAVGLLAVLPLTVAAASDQHHPQTLDVDHQAISSEHPQAMSSDHDESHAMTGADHSNHRQLFNKPVDTVSSVKIDIVDINLLDQHNQSMNFAAEAVGDKLIALTIFYSTCTTVCPVSSAIFAALQDKLGQRLGRDVHLISLSVDPTTDTPRRLQAYSEKLGAKPGWLWLTGEKRGVDKVLSGLGLYSSDYAEHPAAVLVGDGKSGHWSRFYGFPGPDKILQQLDKLQLARLHEKTASLAKE